MKTAIPINMPKSVVTALAKIWKGVLPENMATICYTYGDVCYTPQPLSKDLEKHEAVHTKQQGNDPDAWWDKYGEHAEFRYSQELEAYRVQYRYFKAVNGKIKAYNFAKWLANQMASEMYGGMCTAHGALSDILRD